MNPSTRGCHQQVPFFNSQDVCQARSAGDGDLHTDGTVREGLFDGRLPLRAKLSAATPDGGDDVANDWQSSLSLSLCI